MTTLALAVRTPRSRAIGVVIAAIAGILVLYVGGLAQLSIITGSVTTAVVMGVLPFVVADLLKAIVAAALSGRRSGTSS